MVSGTFKSLLVLAFSLIIIFFSNTSFAQEKGAPAGKEAPSAFDAERDLLSHVKDAYEFHFFETGKIKAVLPLPVIVYSPGKGLSFFSSAKLEEGKEYDGYRIADNKIVAVDPSVKVYDFSLTRNVVQMFLALILLVWLFVSVGQKYARNGYKVAPSGAQGLLEPIIIFIRDEVGVPNLGKNTDKYMPYLLTVFFFILLNVLFALLPGSANVVGNIAFTGSLALIAFLVILFSSKGGYWKHMLWPPGVPFLVKVILIPIEIVSNLIVKPGALMIRLFANMIAGHIVILALIALIFIFGEMSSTVGWIFSPVSIAFSVFIYLIELLVAFIQSFIFTTLTAVFISQALEDSHGHDEHAPAVI
jgi:F-type H+-transporting ATPase subunit a